MSTIQAKTHVPYTIATALISIPLWAALLIAWKVNGDIETWQQVGRPSEQQQQQIDSLNIIAVPAQNKHIAMIKREPYPENLVCGSLHGRNPDEFRGMNLDVYHYKGKEKPWLQTITSADIPTAYSTSLEGRDAWLYWLGVANRTWNLQLPSTIEQTGMGPSVLDWTSDRNMILQPHIQLPSPSF